MGESLTTAPVHHHVFLRPGGALPPGTLVVRLDGPEAWSAPLPPDLASRVAWLETRATPDLEPATGEGRPPIDFLMTNPAAQAPLLHRVARAQRRGRVVRITVPAIPGVLAALRVAASLGLRVRLALGQPSDDVLEELRATVDLYLRGPGTEAPVEPWHSALACVLGHGSPRLWEILEHDPERHRFSDASGRETDPLGAGEPLPASFVADLEARLEAAGAECLACELRAFCGGYFKWPDPAYRCTGVRALFAAVRAAADELRSDLAQADTLADDRRPE